MFDQAGTVFLGFENLFTDVGSSLKNEEDDSEWEIVFWHDNFE